MEEMSAPSTGVFKMGSQSFESPAAAARRRRMEIRRLKVIANAGSLSAEPVSKRSRPVIAPSAIVHGDGDENPPEPDIDVVTRSFHSFLNNNDDDPVGVVDECPHEIQNNMFEVPPSCPSLQQDAETLSVDDSLPSYTSEDENAISMETNLSLESSNLAVGSDDGCLSAGEHCSKATGNDRSPSSSDLDNCAVDAAQNLRITAVGAPKDSVAEAERESRSSLDLQADPEADSVDVEALNLKVLSVPSSSRDSGSGGKNSCVVDSNRIPPWAYASICGRRPEMEDAVAAVPGFLSLPCGTVGGCVAYGSQMSNESSALHFFGVYDGHGGAQAANFCKARLHRALVEELELVMNGEGTDTDGREINWQRQWEKALGRCFKKVDAEVGGGVYRRDGCGEDILSECCSEPVAPETVGSTAVVAIVGSCQVIVANCGDSRAVLCRGGRAIPLSVDHKPQREDEMARIEAAGGKVIDWNGYRVLGVLAMSRAIGDRYLKPCIIPDPEITFTERAKEDECLILASDGLWDVVPNEEACNVARRCIVRWHINNSGSSSKLRDDAMDPAAQAAADHLTKLAIQRRSNDNITVLVVDLKAKRRQGPRS